MASQQQKESHVWDSDTYLKILLNFINQSIHTLPSPLFDRNKKFTGKDMDRLLPEQFKHIVGLIFQGKAPADLEEALSSGVHRPLALTTFGSLYQGFGSATYDVQQLKLYHALRKLFPTGDDTLAPSVIINPSGDPARTRKVLKYLTNMMIFIDQIELQFEEVNDQLVVSGQEYNELVSRLDELKVAINGRLEKLDDWKQEIPSLEVKSGQLSTEALSLEEHVTSLELDVQNLEKEFNRMKDRNRAVFQQNQTVKAEIAAKEEQIVPNGDVLMQEYKFESDKVQELSKHRERCGERLKTLQEKQVFFDSINERVSFIIQCFKDVIQQMDDAAYGKSDCKRLEGEYQEKMETIEEIKRKLDRLKAQNVVKTAEGSNINREKQQNWKHIQSQLILLTKKADDILKDANEMLQRSLQKGKVLCSKSLLANNLLEKIKEDEDYVFAMTAAADQDAMNRIFEVRDLLREEFSDLLT